MRNAEQCALIDSLPQPAEHDVYNNFARFSVAFSLNHAVVVTALSLSPAELGLTLGAYGNGALYVAYTLAALLLSTGVVAAWGAKRSVVVSLGLYSVYVVCYLGAIVARSHENVGSEGSIDSLLAWALVLVGACLGGVGAGWMWTGQGAYFTAASQALAHGVDETEQTTTGPRYATAGTTAGTATNAVTDTHLQQVTSRLSGLFGFWFLGLEVVVKVVVSSVMRAADGGTGDADDGHGVTGVEAAFSVLLGLAVGATVIMQHLVWDKPDGSSGSHGAVTSSREDGGVGSSGGGGGGGRSRIMTWRKAMLALQLLNRSDRLMLVLAPFQVAFGFMSSLLNFYVNGKLASVAVGNDNVAFLNAFTPAVAALLSPVLGCLGQRARLSKHVILQLGLIAFLIEALLLRIVSDSDFKKSGWTLVSIPFLLQGVGRATFETTNKALIADYFGHTGDTEAAFANVVAFSGGAASLGFFFFPVIRPSAMADCCIVACTLGIWGLKEAHRRNTSMRYHRQSGQ